MDAPKDEVDLPQNSGAASWREIATVVGTAIVEFRKMWTVAAPRIGEVIRRVAAEFPPAYRLALIEIAKRGWYIDQQMGLSMPPKLAAALAREESRHEAESELTAYFISRLDAIELEICERFPQRAHIIEPAFAAHRAGQYVLSIPVFLAQADGICYEKIRAYHFMRDRGSNQPPATARHARSDEHDLWNAIVLSPLSAVVPLNMNKNERGPDFLGLNRHTVMHGDSLDYGTEANSLKAISFLNYVSQVLTRKNFKERLEENRNVAT